MLETLLGQKKIQYTLLPKHLNSQIYWPIRRQIRHFFRAVNRALDGVFGRQKKNRGGKSHDRVPLNYLC
jgi:hypothetical protein